MNRIIRIAGLSAAVIALGAASIFGATNAMAQEGGPDGPPEGPPRDGIRGEYRDAFDEALADELGVTVDELTEAREFARNAVLDQMVADGVITREQADWIKEHGFVRPERFFQGQRHEVVAEALGLTVEELKAAHDEGKTIEDLLEEQGLTEEEFEANLLAATEAQLAELVAEGVLTQEQADRMLERAEQRIENGPMPGGQRPGGRGGPHGGPGFDPPPDDG